MQPHDLILPFSGAAIAFGAFALGTRYVLRRQLREISSRLRERESQMRTIVQGLPIPVLISNLEDGEILFANEAFGRTVGCDAASLVGQRTLQFFADAEERKRLVELLHREGAFRGIDTRGRRLDGTEFWWSISSAMTEFGGRTVAVTSYLDVSERKEEEARVLDMNARLEARIAERTEELTRLNSQMAARMAAVDSAWEAVMITDAEGRIEFVNPAFTRITGYSPEEVLGRTPAILNSGAHSPTFFQVLWDTIKSGAPWKGEVVNRRKDGSHYTEEGSITPVLDREGRIVRFVAIKEDISSRKKLEAELQRAAYSDTLTGLPNRLLFQDRLQQAIASAKRRPQTVGLLFMDLDGFKAVNDTHGHEVGDRVLVEAAQRIRALAREADTAARLGGDEFGLLLTTLRHPEDADLVAAKLVAALSAPIELGSITCQIGTSIGIAYFPETASTPMELLQRADAAMYQAKRHGKNRYRVYESEGSPK